MKKLLTIPAMLLGLSCVANAGPMDRFYCAANKVDICAEHDFAYDVFSAFFGASAIPAGKMAIPAFGTATVTDITYPSIMSYSDGRCGLDHNHTQILAFGVLSGPGPNWLTTNDTVWCPELGIDNPVFISTSR